MRLKRLTIRTLPGIEPGFTFEPPGAGVNIVTGPNAIGKSSLARALGYLLRAQKSDPQDLSLEAEFENGKAGWRVRRNGSNVTWYRGGDPAPPPALPATGLEGLYRLSVEHLLAGDDARDKDLAQSLRNSLFGDFDLDAPRLEAGPRFAQKEEKKLLEAESALRQTERDYDALEREMEGLPRLDERIEAAEEAENRRKRLQHGLELHDAIETRHACARALEVFPAGMEKLRGTELDRLGNLEEKQAGLKQKLHEQERRLERAETLLADTGLQQKKPGSQDLDAIDQCLRQLVQKTERRSNVREQLAWSKAVLKNARKPFNDADAPPRLDVSGLEQAEQVAVPLIKAQAALARLQGKLNQAGAAPDGAEIDRLYDAGKALRKWLAAAHAGRALHAAKWERWLHYFLCIVLASGAALLLLVPGVLMILFGMLVAVSGAALAWDWFILRRARRGASLAAQEAREEFMRTGVGQPRNWSGEVVERYLREVIEVRYNALLRQREQTAQEATIRPELEEAEAEVERLLARKREIAQELGFDPALPGISPDMFLEHCRQLAEAENACAKEQARFDDVTGEIAEDIDRVRAFLDEWHGVGAPVADETGRDRDVALLQSLFNQLQSRAQAAKDAENEIKGCREAIRSIGQDMETNRDEIVALFADCGLEAGSRSQLEQRLERLPKWQEKRKALENAEQEEKRIRALLEAHPDIIKHIEQGHIADLQNGMAVAAQQAGEFKGLIEQRAEMKTRLDHAGADQRLSRARAAADSAGATLRDKREQAWLFEATEALLDDVEQTYQAEHVPPTLRRAQALFRAVTRGAFELQLEKDGGFCAQDRTQNARRNLEQLSSGTRMQLLLALRLAWIEAQEQGGEALPLFLDEALTTSDEDRFGVMANSVERLADTEGRQVFYLSARRHECALWKQLTGNEPPAVDLAGVRFPGEAHPPRDYAITTRPPLPLPEGRGPEEYASVLGVPLVDPRREPGAIHPFHLLRDDLDLLYRLLETWGIASLGQLEALLGSDAGPAAITDAGLRDTLRRRCAVTRAWTALWRRGRGRPVDRIALERSGAVSPKFIDSVTKLAESVAAAGQALIRALREGQAPGFRSAKIDDLERWLADESYTDEEEILPVEERRRLALQQAMSGTGAEIEDVNQVITWLESVSP